MSYKIYGAEGSPYSVKVRAYFRYKGIPHEFIAANPFGDPEVVRIRKVPVIPVIVAPDERILQDSTPVIEGLEEAMASAPAIHPADSMLRFLSELLEEYGDEWATKWLLHYRWYREVDQQQNGLRLARENSPVDAAAEDVAQFAAFASSRQKGRLWVVGSNEKTKPIIEADFLQTVAILEAHLARRPYLFGYRPAFADFGVGLQIYECLVDHTAGKLLRERAPRVSEWCARMLWPAAEGEFETWESLRPTLEPLLQRVAIFLRWSTASSRAMAAGEKEMSVVLQDGSQWWQVNGGPQKYQARAFAELRRKYAKVAGDAALHAVLDRCGCLGDLVATPASKL